MYNLNNLFETLKRKNLQQKDLAAYLGTSPSVISDWKIGRIKPSIDDIVRSAEFLGVSIDYLLGDSDTSKWSYELFCTLPKDTKKALRYSLGNTLLEMGEESELEELLGANYTAIASWGDSYEDMDLQYLDMRISKIIDFINERGASLTSTHPEANGQAKFSLKREIAAQFKESDASTHQVAAYGEGYVSESDENGEGEEIK